MNEEEKKVKSKENKAPLSERIGDAIEDTLDGVQEAIYGPGDDFNNDIPAMIQKPSGPKKIIKVQTRRNFNKVLFKTKGFKIALVVFAIGAVIALFYFVMGQLMK